MTATRLNYSEVRTGDENAHRDVESGIYEALTPINKDMQVLDLGAHIGCFARAVAPRCKFLVAFEPEPSNYALLLFNTKDLPNVLPVNAAAFDANTHMDLQINPGNSGGHGFYPNFPPDAHVSVKVVDIGLWLVVSGWIPDFVKIDTEGSELNILESLVRHNVRSALAIEVHSVELYRKCRSLLEYNNYEFQPTVEHVGVCYAVPRWPT